MLHLKIVAKSQAVGQPATGSPNPPARGIMLYELSALFIGLGARR